jgi:hypothetical protein
LGAKPGMVFVAVHPTSWTLIVLIQKDNSRLPRPNGSTSSTVIFLSSVMKMTAVRMPCQDSVYSRRCWRKSRRTLHRKRVSQIYDESERDVHSGRRSQMQAQCYPSEIARHQGRGCGTSVRYRRDALVEHHLCFSDSPGDRSRRETTNSFDNHCAWY